MTAPNHIVGGITLTGICGGFLGVNILESPFYLATIIFAAQLPDIDHTKSIIGLTFYPIAKYLNRSYGHRTITHSLVALILLSLLAGMASNYFAGHRTHGTIFFLAYLSHLVLDMTTVQGVPLFYPFLKNPCVVPGDPKMRFESGNLRTETMAFFFFIAMGVFMQPLMKDGWWTTYNRALGSMKHLYSEFRKSEDLLEVEYIGHKGSDRVVGKGYVIQAATEKAILLQQGKFFALDKKEFVIEKVIPTHTGRKYFYKNQTFVNIHLDSLNALCLDQLITKIEIHSNQPFIPWTHDWQQPSTKKFKGEYYSTLFFQEKQQQQQALATYRHLTNPRIKLLQDKLTRLENLDKHTKERNRSHQRQLNRLRTQSKNETNYLKIEQLLTQIKQLEKQPKEKEYSDQIDNTKIQIQELIELDKLKRIEGTLKVSEKNQGVGEEAPIRFTGFLTTLTIE